VPFLQRDDVQLYYEVKGQGRPFVFVSETACDGEVWKMYSVPEFSRDHQCITFDYRGTGRSSRPSIKYTTDIFAQDAAAIMDHVGAKDAIVCGHSMGGRVAQLLALDHPGKVSKLILASTGASFPETKGIPLKLAKEMVETGYERYVSESSVAVGFTEEFAREHPDRVQAYLDIRMANVASPECYLRHVIARQEHDTSHRLKDIKVPTLILVGEDDRSVTSDMGHRESADILACAIPGARLVILPGERHSYFFANPEAAHKAIRDFL
jgi:3-oxoadipate enol-lactonase